MLKYLNHYLEKGIRFDGRAIDALRSVSFELGVSETAEGSALVTWGNTKVIAGVKLSVEEPFPDVPDKGNLMVNAELLPLSSPDFESGPPGIEAIELARVVDRGIRESGAVDLTKLCIEPGKKVWTVMVDICTLNHDGNLLDAAGLAALLAIMDARFPGFDGETVDYKTKTDQPLPLVKKPLPITVSKINGHFLVDLTKEEEQFVDARLTVTSTEDGKLCALQKGGDVGLSLEEIKTMIDLALTKAKEIRENLKL